MRIRRKARFRDAVASEWTKLWSVRSTFWSLLATVVVTIGLSALLSIAYVVSAARGPSFDPGAYGLAGLNFGVITLGVLGVLVISTEYATGMIRTSLAAVPRRSRLLAAKALVLGLITLVVGEAVSFASFFLSQAIFATKDLDVTLGAPGMLRAVLGGGLYLTLIALLSLGVGAILRHTAGAITAVLGVLFVLPIFGAFLPGGWGRTVQKLLPSNAGGAILATRELPASLAPWTGFTVFAGYTAVVLVIAFVLFARRDA
ncbi:ABC transporter permease subunit [Streptosporangiaceae bacterium NEAU-GS5]|nr:ABC transporter permease subunit [Streptosporangiaceae bacterium NEAU-GS5]